MSPNARAGAEKSGACVAAPVGASSHAQVRHTSRESKRCCVIMTRPPPYDCLQSTALGSHLCERPRHRPRRAVQVMSWISLYGAFNARIPSVMCTHMVPATVQMGHGAMEATTRHRAPRAVRQAGTEDHVLYTRARAHTHTHTHTHTHVRTHAPHACAADYKSTAKSCPIRFPKRGSLTPHCN